VKKLSAPLLLLALLVLGGSPCSADVAPTTLEKLIKVCKYAVVGKVTRIIKIDGAKIDEMHVLMTVKGSRNLDRVYFVAQPTWTDDTCHAVLDETALLFLQPEPPGVDESSPFRKKEREVIGNNHLWLIAWSGCGRLPITRVGQIDYVRVLADANLAEVRFPKQIATIPSPEPSGRIRLARLDDVIAFVKRRART
jgi:hypothetical protein